MEIILGAMVVLVILGGVDRSLYPREYAVGGRIMYHRPPLLARLWQAGIAALRGRRDSLVRQHRCSVARVQPWFPGEARTVAPLRQ
ncbi:MAG: hypothetical protein ACOX2L_09465 [Anaerolineae bacterium]|jgi:hypothetical protein|nr:hypothetical protein [Chloroflexota bacterium]